MASFRFSLIKLKSMQTELVLRKVHNLTCNKAFVNGKWVTAQSGKMFDVYNPATGDVVASVPDMNVEDFQDAIKKAYDAFATWKNTTAKERSHHLRNWFNLMMQNQEELAKLMTAEQGKPVKESAGEIVYAASFFEWYSEECRRIYGEVVPAPVANKEMMFIRQPIGVAAMITPWNFPSAMITRKVGAALAAGCTCVIKPSEDTPLSALALGKLAEAAKIPPGVVNILTASSENAPAVGKLLCESPQVAGLSFTGSSDVGKLLYQQSASTVKKLSLELGGNAPFIVFDSANLDQAVSGILASKFRNSGQTCVSANRILIQEGIHDRLVRKLAEAMKKTLIVGDGFDSTTTQGPLINRQQALQVDEKVKDAVDKGARVLIGGKFHSKGDLFYEPTLITEAKGNMRICQEEIFGPVAVITRFRTEDDALALANASNAGLAGYFYSNDISQAWRVAKRLEVGMVGINDGLISCAEGAFGGVKESGIGREGSRHGIDEYTNIKYICFGNL
uniref:Succinate-semialdehyde dehydrogenase n=1 Tax=Strigamia maritima TaxID=126957 RepID=T1J0G5_STRMM